MGMIKIMKEMLTMKNDCEEENNVQNTSENNVEIDNIETIETDPQSPQAKSPTKDPKNPKPTTILVPENVSDDQIMKMLSNNQVLNYVKQKKKTRRLSKYRQNTVVFV
jgi:hypothetical protein